MNVFKLSMKSYSHLEFEVDYSPLRNNIRECKGYE